MTRRIMLVSPFATGDVQDGGALVVRGLVSALAARHQVVWVIPEGRGPRDEALEELCLAVHAFGTPAAPARRDRGDRLRGLARGRTVWATELHVGALRAALPALLERHQPDVVQLELSVLGDALAVVDGPARVLTIHDPARAGFTTARARSGGRAVADWLDAAAGLLQERRAIRRADAVVALSDRDLDALRKGRGLPPASAVIPLGWSVPQRALHPAGREPPTLLYVGNFNHRPNIDAASRLVTRVLPDVWRAHPEVTLEIVGADPPSGIRELAGPRVRVTGRVASVEPHLDRAAVVVAPVSTGGGVRTKILEALAAGKATVTTPLGAGGIGAASCDALVVADDDAQLAVSISRLLADPAERAALGERARRWAEGALSWEAMADRFEELYERLATRNPPGA